LNSLPASRNSTLKKVSQTSRRAAETAVPPGKTTTEDRLREKCILLSALHAAKRPRCHLNQAATNLSIAAIVFPKEETLKPHNTRRLPAGHSGG